MNHNRKSQVYRVRQLPLHLKNREATAPFLAGIAPDLGAVDNIHVFSLAQEKSTFKTATVTFKTLPSIFDNDEQQWTLRAEVLCGRNIIVDTHFQAFTVLNEPQRYPHTVDCVAISGLASHPFGSWKHRESGSDFMWLRDRLPQDIPQLRSLIYGYDTKLFKSHSFQDLDDIARSFIASLKEIRRSPWPAKSLIFLAHSLGGIVLKRAMVLLAYEGDDEEKTILDSVKAVVFFGVPHRGMKISHFLAMVAQQPNEDLISRTLSPDSALLPELNEQFTKIALPINQNIRFVYETTESQTTEASFAPHFQGLILTLGQQTATGAWVRSETSYAVLVKRDSAVPPGTLPRNAIPVNKDHSNMVKFGEDDPVYQIIMSFLSEISSDKDSQGFSQSTSALPEATLSASHRDIHVEKSPTSVDLPALQNSLRATQDPTKGHVVDTILSIPVQKTTRTFSTVPFSRDSNFIGREKILAQLESEFGNPKSQGWASLYGLGGIGKSQIAIEHSYRRKERSPQISTFWVHASSKARFEQSYAELATTVDIPGAGDGKIDVLQFVSKWLGNPDNGPWLLILDNADDATVLMDLPKSDTETGAAPMERRLLNFLPRVEHGTIVITTRDRACALSLTGHRVAPIEVESMTLDESVNLLRNVLPNADQEEACELVQELENVPLAVSQASAYINEFALLSIPEYLATFRRSNEDQAALLNKDEGDLRRDPGVPNAVITSWELSFNLIRKSSPRSADLLSLMSYFNRQAIPQFLVQGDANKIAFYEDINPLLNFSLIRAEIAGETFEMHRLVQIAMRHWLRSESCEELWKDQAMKRMAHRFPARDREKHWPVCEALMSHADEVVLHMTSSKESQLSCAHILVGMARYLVERKGHGRLAEQRSTHALQIQRQYFDDDSDEILETLNIVAYAYRELAQLEKARSLDESLLKQRLRIWGPENDRTLSSMHNLAVSHDALGQYEKAEDLLKHVFKVNEMTLGSEDPRTLVSGSVLANIQLKQGKYEEAEKLSTKILEISTRSHGIEPTSTLGAMRTLCDARLGRGKSKEAENMIAQAIPFFTKLFGPSHWRTLEARTVLAKTYYYQRKLVEAQEICEQCFDIARQHWGQQHLVTLNIMNLLGVIYRGQGNFIEASGLLEAHAESSKGVLGADDPVTLTILHNLALCYYDMGDKDYAIQLMKKVQRKRRDVLHAGHPHIALPADCLAFWKSEEEESEEEGSEEEEKSEEEGREEEESGDDDVMRELLANIQISSPATQEASSK